MSRFVPLMLFAGLCIILAVGLVIDTREIKSAYLDKSMPEFNLPDLESPDKKFSHSELKSKIVIFNVWASWCPSCYLEHPVLLKLAKNPKIYLAGLNYKDSRINALSWLKKHGNPYKRIAWDFKGDAGIDFGVSGVPETFVIDQHGKIRFKHAGTLTHKIVESRILPLIRKLGKAR